MQKTILETLSQTYMLIEILMSDSWINSRKDEFLAFPNRTDLWNTLSTLDQDRFRTWFNLWPGRHLKLFPNDLPAYRGWLSNSKHLHRPFSETSPFLWHQNDDTILTPQKLNYFERCLATAES